jgi:hypothetical protein
VRAPRQTWNNELFNAWEKKHNNSKHFSLILLIKFDITLKFVKRLPPVFKTFKSLMVIKGGYMILMSIFCNFVNSALSLVPDSPGGI